MERERAIYANMMLVIDEYKIPVAAELRDGTKFRLYDQVWVNDYEGYPGPGIKHGGFGRIMEIRREATDGNYFGVLMSNGEFGYTMDKYLRLA